MKKLSLCFVVASLLVFSAANIRTAHAGRFCDWAHELCGVNDHNIFAWLAGAQAVCRRMANSVCDMERNQASNATLQQQLDRIQLHRDRNYKRKVG